MSRLLYTVLALTYIVLFVPSSSTPSHGPPPCPYKTPGVCTEYCLSRNRQTCDCVADGRYKYCNEDWQTAAPNEHIANVFITCFNDEIKVDPVTGNDYTECAVNQVYDDRTKQCDSMATCRTPEPCSDYCISSNSYGCDAVANGDYKYCDDDKAFVSCWDGQLIPYGANDYQTCPAGLVWDDNEGIKRCEWVSSCPPLSGAALDGVEISQSVLYGVVSGIILLLILNISCLCYMNYIKPRKGNKNIKYSKVDMVVSSDDDRRHLKGNQI